MNRLIISSDRHSQEKIEHVSHVFLIGFPSTAAAAQCMRSFTLIDLELLHVQNGRILGDIAEEHNSLLSGSRSAVDLSRYQLFWARHHLPAARQISNAIDRQPV